MSVPQEEASKSNEKSKITFETEIDLYISKKKREPTFREDWETMSEESIVQMVDQMKAEATEKLSCSGNQNSTRYSLLDRKNHWMSQKRRRTNGICDKYYYHGLANWIFRSRIEVTNFVLHEAYPKKAQKTNMSWSKDADQKKKSKSISDEESSQNHFQPSGFEVGPIKMPPLKREGESSQAEQAIEENMARAVEEFLAEAWKNLQNSDKTNIQSSEGKSELEVAVKALTEQGHTNKAILNSLETEEAQPAQGDNENMTENALGRGDSRTLDLVAAGDMATESLDEDFTKIPLCMDFDSLLKTVYENIQR